MELRKCPVCGGKLRSESIGWICYDCQGFIDMQGVFHEHIEKQFMPPQTNADRIRAMSDEELARHLHCIGWDCHLCAEHRRLDNEPLLRDQRCDENCFEHCLEWLKQPAEK